MFAVYGHLGTLEIIIVPILFDQARFVGILASHDQAMTNNNKHGRRLSTIEEGSCKLLTPRLTF